MIHAVFPDACISCQKCFEVCPTEGIEMRPLEATLQTWYWPDRHWPAERSIIRK